MSLAPPVQSTSRPSGRGHIIDVLIAERAPRLASTPVWPVLRPLLYQILDYAKAVRMADAIGPMAGAAALDHVSNLLELKVFTTGLDRIPATGRAVVVCNHPTGIADGVAVYDALKTLRPDICFYANSDAHRVSPRFEDVLIPVEWVEAKRTRERTRQTLLLTRQAMESERLLAIFPAGRLARQQANGVICDPEWQPSAISLAKRYEAPLIPIHVAGPRSSLFHLFNRVSTELRDMTLFHEFLNKQGLEYRLTVGPPIPTAALEGDPAEVTPRVKRYVEAELPGNPDRPFA